MSDCESMGDCADSRIERLYEYLDGALSHQDLVEIKDHLEGCPECAEEPQDRRPLTRSCLGADTKEPPEP
jgi:anti-sigma factor (TIGR02949 family)